MRHVRHRTVRHWSARAALAAVLTVAAPFAAVPTARAADIPKSTQEFLKQLNFGEDKLAGLDKELAVPQAWIDDARKNPTVRVGGSEDPPLHAQMIKPFLERYPFIKVQFQRGSANERVIRPLLAFREGRYLMDVVRSMDGSLSEFIAANAATDMRDLPTFNVALDGSHADGGIAISFRQRPYCMAYNPDLVREDQMPKTWKDLPNTPILANGRIGVVMLPHLWFMPLWGKFGEEWAAEYLDDFFVKLQPQVRREGLNAAMSLVGAGENYVSIPAYAERIKQLRDKGSPVKWYCPQDIVPVERPNLTIFRGTPNMAAAKLYVNWVLSKEGQIAQLAVFEALPIHKDLQSDDFWLYPDQMRGRELINFNDQEATEKFLKMWNKYALGASGK